MELMPVWKKRPLLLETGVSTSLTNAPHCYLFVYVLLPTNAKLQA